MQVILLAMVKDLNGPTKPPDETSCVVFGIRVSCSTRDLCRALEVLSGADRGWEACAEVFHLVSQHGLRAKSGLCQCQEGQFDIVQTRHRLEGGLASS